MIKSMTGFGKLICSTENRTYNIVLQTLNSKLPDITIKMPSFMSELEIGIRNLLVQKLERGKINLSITLINENISSSSRINFEQAKLWFEQLLKLKETMGIKTDSDYLTLLLNLPDVINVSNNELSDNEKEMIMHSIKEVISQVDQFRIEEGELLSKDFIMRINIILNYLDEIEYFDAERKHKVEEKLKNDYEKFSSHIELDESRFIQEIFYYIEKLDITEEKIRLSKHCKSFIETINEKDTSGRKLNFISQEIGREINTVGSKANDYEIQHRVIFMKDELEKIKEQLNNIL